MTRRSPTTTKKKNNKAEETTAKEEKSDKDTDTKDKDNSGLWKIGLISGAAVIGLISLELFIYKMAKLKKGSK
ncbi:hypothetical protein [Ruminococcus sp.]|uniref:hypothetical protein n=1 Tax=Ruminococcus sp. TaxID=41978 RepID=UPI002BA534A7|nr:hypothetical protein [Ruminococcus sp.]HNZ98678.1 hypothetical protein [Ruminococcus sp.]HOH86479.1 hypothetical protein [Ruminococcus sp.]